MRVSCVALLLVVAMVGAAHGQLALGPNGVSAPPINLVTVYKYIRNFWSSLTGKTVPETINSVKVTSGGPEKRQAGDDTDYDTELQGLKQRIQQASTSAIVTKEGQVDPDAPPLTRAILLPKKKVVLGKWPIVYGVLNSILLAAAIVLAKPYFYEGETVVSAYSNEHGYGGHGYPVVGYTSGSGYGHEYSDEHKGEFHKHKGYSKPPRGYASYNKGAPQAYAVVPASEIHQYSSPPPKVIHRPHAAPMYSSHMRVVDSDERRHKRPTFDHRSGEYSRHNRDNADHEDEPPFSELHYYNPTVFTASDPSSYACLERMVCMNPSRSAREIAITAMAAESRTLSTEDESLANWENMISRLDDAVARGERKEDCAQYYCPPQLPDFFEALSGDSYSPPPKYPTDSYSAESSFQKLIPVGYQEDEFIHNPITLHQLHGAPFSGIIGNDNLIPSVHDSFEDNFFDRADDLMKRISPAASDDLVEKSSPRSEDLIKKITIGSDNLMKRTSPVSIEYVQAPKISTSEYAKVMVHNPTSEVQEDSPKPQIAELKHVNRENRGFVLPLTLSAMVRDRKK